MPISLFAEKKGEMRKTDCVDFILHGYQIFIAAKVQLRKRYFKKNVRKRYLEEG